VRVILVWVVLETDFGYKCLILLGSHLSHSASPGYIKCLILKVILESTMIEWGNEREERKANGWDINGWVTTIEN
jgi:hypothetical protein